MNICLKPEVDKIKGFNTSNPERSGQYQMEKDLHESLVSSGKYAVLGELRAASWKWEAQRSGWRTGKTLLVVLASTESIS